MWLRGPLYSYDVLSEDYTRSGPQMIALKSLDNSKNITPQYCRMTYETSDKYFEWCYGITQDPVYKDYMLVMDYAREGNLYDHIKDKTMINLDWIKVIEDCFELAKMLNGLHNRNLVHGNLHGGNVLATIEGFAVTDMGLGHPADKVPFAKIYGVLPFVSPEVICGGRYTMAADIYSFGIIMWMLASMQLPYADRAHDLELAKHIINGLRPTIDIFIPDLFLSLMKRCWSDNVKNRPTSNELLKLLSEWRYALNNFDYTDDDFQEHLIISQIEEVDDVYMDTNIVREHNIHEKAVFTSQLIDFCSLRQHHQQNESPIDNLLKSHLNIIPYEQFDEVKLISHGGYSSMYSAIWTKKIKLKEIHDLGLVHKNLHGGNLFPIDYDEYEWIITDTGITKSTYYHLYGVLPYMAPEVLQYNKYTHSSDIYSLSMIMYIVLTGFKPFHTKSHDIKLATKVIVQHRRPKFYFPENYIPNDYLKLLKQCWSHSPSLRPDINQIINLLEDWLTQLDHRSSTRITQQFSKCETSGRTNPADIYYCEDDSYCSRDFTGWKNKLYFL
ncbi:8593_t:CDS:2 [Funneliformis geosporum]|nr:8593_t:CDS:2 [Funneliformis geosporum]